MHEQSPPPATPVASCALERAMDIFQEFHMDEVTPRQALAAFDIFCNDKSAIIFYKIQQKELRSLWLKVVLEQLVVAK
jgi:hypothetical protein